MMRVNPQSVEDVGSGGLLRPPVSIRGISIDTADSTSPWSPSVTLTVVVGLSAGTGSYAHGDTLTGKSFRPAIILTSHEDAAKDEANQTPYTVEQLSDFRKILGLNVSELANVLRGQRPTIYQWQRGNKLRPKNAHRLGELHTLAVQYRDKGISNASRYLHVPQDGAPSLFDLLNADILDKQAITSVLDKVLARQARSSTLRKRTSAAVEKHGFEDVSPEEQDANLEQHSSSIS